MALKVMLAASEIPRLEELRFPLMCSVKLDGIRSPIVDGVAQSRKMIPIPNQQYQKWAADWAGRLNGFDGEGIVGLPYGDGVFNRCTRGLGKADREIDFTYHAFDLWDMPDASAWERYEALQERAAGIPHVSVVEQRLLKTKQQLLDMSAESLGLGYEGLILKAPRGKYKNGRSTVNEGILLKWKMFVDSECVILEVVQGLTNTNPDIRDALGHAKRSTAKAGKVGIARVGSFKVRDIHTGVEFNCAAGGTEEESTALWLIHDKLPGRVFTYRAQKYGTLNKPRFPGFKAWRPEFDLEVR